MAGKIIALVPAAGVGSRFGEALPKQYLPLNGQPLIVHTLKTLASIAQLSEVVVVLSPEDQLWATQMAAWPQWALRVRPLWVGGNSRGASVANGLAALADRLAAEDWVLVHDAARPCLQVSWVQRLIDEVTNDAVGGLLALPLADTVKRADGEGRVSKTVPRDHLWRAQTPQMFRYGMLGEALKQFPA
ncbi:MAG: 2-C-methyl-D-erythritol 4-phosphate cytidylyltransferase, partial [Betaproteobacteria bacterium]|nr:2-C-methyl-D-erythritol 4-phosphate cytidylyltransferase [Betaproteobacteria bacterium]